MNIITRHRRGSLSHRALLAALAGIALVTGTAASAQASHFIVSGGNPGAVYQNGAAVSCQGNRNMYLPAQYGNLSVTKSTSGDAETVYLDVVVSRWNSSTGTWYTYASWNRVASTNLGPGGGYSWPWEINGIPIHVNHPGYYQIGYVVEWYPYVGSTRLGFRGLQADQYADYNGTYRGAGAWCYYPS
jgi:hypothetical protein